MASQQSTQAPNDQIAELGQRMARIETKMDHVASAKALIASREASMQRWQLGITATTMVGVSTAMAGEAAALIQTFG